MKQARRDSEYRKYITLAFCASDKYLPVYLHCSRTVLILTTTVFFLFCGVTLYISRQSGRWLAQTSNYQQTLARNQLLKAKIQLATGRQRELRDYIHELKKQETEIEEMLSFTEPAAQPAAGAILPITTHHIVTPRGELGRVLIDNNIVVEYFDNSEKPMAFQRALVTAEKLKSLIASHTPARKFKIKKAGNAVYAYINKQPVFVVLPEDIARLSEPLSTSGLARRWLKNIKTALAGQGTATLADRLPLLNKANRAKSRLAKTLYPSINYPAYAAALDSAETNPQLKNVDHLLKLSRQEITASRRSFQELKDTVQAYKYRFAYIPSIFPVRNTYVLSDYGWRQHPLLNRFRFHSGIDLPAWQGAPIYATAAGTVQKTSWSGGYGNYIKIDHGHGFSTLYGHNSVNLVREGEQVQKGQLIGRVGSTGLSEGNHCHYEVHYYDRPVDPSRFLNLNIFTANHNNW